MTKVKLLTFSEVLEGLKEGKKYQRNGWNGKGLYVRLREIEGLKPFFTIVDTVKCDTNTWVPSVSDLLAEDWIEYSEEE